MVSESKFQRELIAELETRFPGCFIMKQDSSYRQGVPDLLILHNDRWAMLEVKASEKAAHQPNQGFWVRELHEMSFAAFVYPENKDEVLDALQSAFEFRRSARASIG